MNKPVNKNDNIILEITAMGSNGQGIGRYDGFAVFVPFTLVGETVNAHIIKVYNSYAVAKLIEVITASPHRVEPTCPVFGRCGGCALQHMDYVAQLEYKRIQVRDAMERIGGFSGVDVSPTVGMEQPLRYRNKGSFPFGRTNDGISWGLYAPRSHRLISIDDCIIERKEAVEAANAVREWASLCNVAVYNEETGDGVLRHVVIRTVSDGVSVTVVTTGALPHSDRLVELVRQHVPSVRSIVHNRNPLNTNVIMGSLNTLLYGEPSLCETICGTRFAVSVESFLQVNPIQAEVLYGLATDGLRVDESDYVIDLYCGIGTITLMLAKHAGRVLGIESVERAISDARRNADVNGISNVEFICGNAEDVLPKLIACGNSPTAISLDPPRKGADPAVLDAIIRSAVDRVAYVSCNPATLARDCSILRNGGYLVESVQPVDMFPMTHHVECVVLMSRG